MVQPGPKAMELESQHSGWKGSCSRRVATGLPFPAFWFFPALCYLHQGQMSPLSQWGSTSQAEAMQLVTSMPCARSR